MPDVFASVQHLTRETKTLLHTPPVATRDDVASVRESIIDDLLTIALFSVDSNLRKVATSTIYQLAELSGARSVSISPLYTAFAEKKISGFTIPALNIRTLTYDIARLIFRLMMQHNLGTVIFELARSEMEYTHQTPMEYALSILAAAIKEGYQGPIFLQGDHYQIHAEQFKGNKDAEINALKKLIQDTLEAKIYNIDIDASPLVDLTQTSLPKQQFLNSQMTAFFTEFIRANSPKDQLVSVGGEIGHIGGKNSTPLEFETFMRIYTSHLSKKTPGISKISIQTGTHHGGTPLPDGSLAPVQLDFSTLEWISTLAREKYHLGGAVQHGASTLPLSLFDQFPNHQTLEIHLSTGIQNIVFDHLPDTLKREMYQWLDKNLSDERKSDQSNEQFYYKTRKKALGPFRKAIWDLTDEEKTPILNELSVYLETIFNKLNLHNTREKVEPFIP